MIEISKPTPPHYPRDIRDIGDIEPKPLKYIGFLCFSLRDIERKTEREIEPNLLKYLDVLYPSPKRDIKRDIEGCRASHILCPFLHPSMSLYIPRQKKGRNSQITKQKQQVTILRPYIPYIPRPVREGVK